MAEQDVYVGVWKDYSFEGVRQLTLTVPLTHGGYLISIMTLLVSLAGTRFWYIMTYALHQLRARPERRSDPVHAQIQTLLRNSITSTGTITDALLMGWAWSGTGMHARRRLIPIILLATACLAAFTLAGTFISSVVTQKTPDVVVLAKAPGCGVWDMDISRSKLEAGFAPDPEDNQLAEGTMDARLYAKWFYADMPPTSVPSSRFPVKKLPFSKRMAPCPFKGEKRCISNDTSSANTTMVLDTGKINSHFHLGLNAPPENRIELRKVMTCSPVNVDDYVDISFNEDGGLANFTRLTNNNLTFGLPKNTLPPTFNGYSAGCRWYSSVLRYLEWAAEPFDRDDADLSLCYVRQESVAYPSKVYDPLFVANGSRFVDQGGQRSYLGSNYMNFIGCLDQVQFCNPVSGSCTNLSSPVTAWIESTQLGFNEYQWLAVNRTAILAALTSTGSHGLSSLGAGGLLAKDQTTGDYISTSLPSNQWEKEAKLWFETGLAMLQGHIIRFLRRIDSTSPMYGRFLIYKPLSDFPEGSWIRRISQTACETQKVTTTNRYQNFNLSALLVVLSCSLLIVFISLVLEPVMMMTRQARMTQKGEWRQKAWDTDGKFSLLRMSMESSGVGPWRQGGGWIKVSIPVVDKKTHYEQVKNREVELDDFLLRGQRQN